MFILKTVHDTIRIPASLLAGSTIEAIHNEIDQKYPNRILMDVGLVIGRYGDCLRIGNGVCVAGDGGSHHECTFRLIVFRPFVEEVLLGTIVKSTSEGVVVSMGFFTDIFIPAYWMLNPSKYVESSGLWVWNPQYDDEEEEEDDKEVGIKKEQEKDGNGETTNGNNGEIKSNGDQEAEDDNEGYEMNVGDEIRFKVKSINFTRITNTAKGTQATMTTTAHLPPTSASSGSDPSGDSSRRPVRQRSSSVGIDESKALPPAMHMVASICEDGLGLTSWWQNEGDGDDDEEEGDDDQMNTDDVDP